MNKKDINQILIGLGLSPAETAVYISLLDGATAVQEIMKKTGEKRPTIYYSLNSLEKRGLVSKTGKEYGNKFQLEPVEKLSELVNKNIRQQEDLLEKVKKIKTFYPTNRPGGKVLVSYFDTRESIKSTIFFSLYCKNKMIRTIVPAENMFNDFGIDFITDYVSEKNKREIKTQAIWEDIPNKKVMDVYYENSEIKQMPVDMHNSFKTTIFIYDNKTLYIGPENENYAVLIESNEHSKMMNAIFNSLWNTSTDIR